MPTSHDFLQNTNEKLVLRPREVCHALGISKATLWRLVKMGKSPKPIRLGLRAVGWPAKDVEQWVANAENAGGATN